MEQGTITYKCFDGEGRVWLKTFTDRGKAADYAIFCVNNGWTAIPQSDWQVR